MVKKKGDFIWREERETLVERERGQIKKTERSEKAIIKGSERFQGENSYKL